MGVNISIDDISFSNLQDFDIDAEEFHNLLDFCVNQQNGALMTGGDSLASSSSIGSSPSLPAPRSCVTLQTSVINSAIEEILNLNNGLIEVKKASFVRGYRMLIEEFEVIKDTFEEEIVLNESVEFLDNNFYSELFKNKGMLNNQGMKNPNHL